MPPRRKRPDPERRAQIVADAKCIREQRDKGYREQALKLFPHVCARCGREFEGALLRELTVHHKDNDHMNNPPDGSNWELLCLYCHDDEHQTPVQRAQYDRSPMKRREPPLTFQAFEGLKAMFGSEASHEESPPRKDSAGETPD